LAKRLKIIILVCILMLCMLCLGSCASDPIHMNILKGQLNVAPLDKKIPLKAGLYLSPAFRTTQTPLSLGATKLGDIYVGEALSDAVEKMMRNLFQEVIILDEMGNGQNSTVLNYDVFVTSEVKKFEFRHVPRLYTAKWATQNTMIWRIASREGKEIYQNEIESNEMRISWLDPKNPEVIIKALNDQLQKAQEDIYSNGWWKKQWWKEQK
jgi:hypothetical protein